MFFRLSLSLCHTFSRSMAKSKKKTKKTINTNTAVQNTYIPSLIHINNTLHHLKYSNMHLNIINLEILNCTITNSWTPTSESILRQMIPSKTWYVHRDNIFTYVPYCHLKKNGTLGGGCTNLGPNWNKPYRPNSWFHRRVTVGFKTERTIIHSGRRNVPNVNFNCKPLGTKK